MTSLLGETHRPLPREFDRLVVIISVQAHVFALLVIWQSWSIYRSITATLLLWFFSLAIPLSALVVAQRSAGVLSRRGLVVVGLAILIVDVGGALMVRPADLGSPAMWIWGVAGVTLLTLSPFRPIREILLLGCAHSLVLLAIMIWARSIGGADAFRILADLNAGLLPVVAAAHFVRLYIDALRTRQNAAGQLAAAEAGLMIAGAVQADTSQRLEWLRSETVPLLEAVASGALSASNQTVVDRAQRLSRDLRRELLEGRSGLWLLGIRADHQRATEILDPQSCLERLADADRAALAVLVESLRDNYSWDRISVVLTLSADLTPADAPRTVLTVVASGTSADPASRDQRVLAAGSQLAATIVRETADLLVADAELPLKARR